ncbi:hypothetical protein BC629DRAFT_719817 [Irpex lacteus]|nr:hypothetical protein BC629DRAFT_719817 [Irpex lacteus]
MIHRQTKTKKPDGFHGDWCKFVPRGSREARRDSQAQKRKEEVNDILRMSAAATKPLIETVAKLGVSTYMYTLLHSRRTTEEVFRTACMWRNSVCLCGNCPLPWPASRCPGVLQITPLPIVSVVAGVLQSRLAYAAQRRNKAPLIPWVRDDC